MENGFNIKAFFILNSDKAQKALVIPHPGHGNPVINLNGQNITLELSLYKFSNRVFK
jgi:hypothetical protein